MVTGDRIPKAPATPDALKSFPDETVPLGTEVWRVHGAGYGPWFFGETQRFSLQSPNGTCHVALNSNTAVLETVVRGARAVALIDLQTRRIRRLRLPRAFRVANFFDPLATGWGVTRRFGTDFPYDRCQGWASAFKTDGFGGIRFWANHDVTDAGVSLALFGPVGERKGWARGTAERLDSAYWLDVLRSELGIGVFDTHSTGLTFGPLN
ncbi:hypothetical protein EUA93_16690 [Nocardioides oleivorans]|uniref:RES domain-containing protein n=1 Tax=Nocardioides oleivorans TaxID=273676 RepID=A0A4Q2RS49_9ACTN|nr:RES domain-containing protein [Nocardioides oleivorans]RYB91777.1 hypothetical protein EUA93_16690 [Nocardioides oleivorans]